jgi:hypothetical protein
MSIRIRYSCPHCSRRIVHHAELAGQLVICSACKGEFYEPTDPLPGRPAEKALTPRAEETRRLRVPEGSNPKHDLAVLSRRDTNDFRSITELVEAVLLDDDPPLPALESQSSIGEETVNDFGYQKPGGRSPRPQLPPSAGPPPSLTPPAQPAPMTPPGPRAPLARPAGNPAGPNNLPGPTMRPLVPPSSFIPMAASPNPQASRSTPKPSVPTAATNRPVPAPGLAGVSIKQMVDELRRRGLGVTLITCDMAPMRNLELAFSENMTREDALALLRKYLDSLRDPNAKPAEQGLLKRMWKKSDGE